MPKATFAEQAGPPGNPSAAGANVRVSGAISAASACAAREHAPRNRGGHEVPGPPGGGKIPMKSVPGLPVVRRPCVSAPGPAPPTRMVSEIPARSLTGFPAFSASGRRGWRQRGRPHCPAVHAAVVVAMVLLAVHIWKGAAPAASQRQEPAAVPVQQ